MATVELNSDIPDRPNESSECKYNNNANDHEYNVEDCTKHSGINPTIVCIEGQSDYANDDK